MRLFVLLAVALLVAGEDAFQANQLSKLKEAHKLFAPVTTNMQLKDLERGSQHEKFVQNDSLCGEFKSKKKERER